MLVVDTKAESRAACLAAADAEGLLADEADTVKAGLEMTLAGRHAVLLVAAEMPDAQGLGIRWRLANSPGSPWNEAVILALRLVFFMIGAVRSIVWREDRVFQQVQVRSTVPFTRSSMVAGVL